ncbi:MAG: hypothetical protein SVR81_08205 [Chloroflexota bacterium]|nr:hypothetical protein [Chloroflexota bacterium]
MASTVDQTDNENKKRLGSLLQGWDSAYFVNFVFAASFSLAFFVRFLDFFITPTWQKLVVFICLVLYFFVLFFFFVTPIVRYLLDNKRKLLLTVLIGAVLATGILFLLPGERVPIRTVHTMAISIPEGSNPVTVSALKGPMESIIPLDDLETTGTLGGESVALQQGESLSYTREMTGGLTMTLSAPAGEAQATLLWDDQQDIITLDGEAAVQIQTDPLSQGTPTQAMRLFLMGVRVNRGLTLFLILITFLGGLDLVFHNEEEIYQINRSELQRYLLDFLIVGFALILIAFGVRYYLPESTPITALILLPGGVFLFLKLLYMFMPSLPFILIGVTLGVNLFANVIWFNRLLSVPMMEERTFNELASHVNPDERTMMSVGFYKQLRGADLILPSGSELSDEDYIQRLIRINYLEDVVLADYQGELTAQEYSRVMAQGEWTQWKKRLPGSFFFYNAEEPINSPIAIFTYEDDVLLVPTEWIDDLGLFHDIVSD